MENKRLNAIYNALKHGLLPWWMYEDKRHYYCSYLAHLWINIQYAWRWATFRELQSDIEFEKKHDAQKIDMKTFIYFSQGEWRTFQAEELPVKPEIPGEFYHLPTEFPNYDSEIAELKSKSLPVGNPEILPTFPKLPINGIVIPKNFKEGEVFQWPGTVEISPGGETIDLAILKLPA